jgi:ADP-ribose pyrophosphatase YjhB (NUDIX family)
MKPSKTSTLALSALVLAACLVLHNINPDKATAAAEVKSHVPILTTSGIVHFCPTNQIALIERGNHPSALELFGGNIKYESVKDGFKRKAKEELNISNIEKLQLAAINSIPGRDTGKHAVDIVFACVTRQNPKAGNFAKRVTLFTKEELESALINKKFALDHKEVLRKYLLNLGSCNPCIQECKIIPEVN